RSARLTHFVQAPGRWCRKTTARAGLIVAALHSLTGFARNHGLSREDAVIPGAFAYHRPKSVKETVAMLADLGEDARPLAGGHSLIPMMKLRLAAPTHLIDLGAIGELRGLRAEGADIVIGAMTTQHELIADATLAAKLPILRETALLIADPQ